MKILVPIKRVVDHTKTVWPLDDGSAVNLRNAKKSINPFCNVAVEEAIRLKESGVATEIIVVSIGDERTKEQLYGALAMGADRAILIKTQDELEPLIIAKCLKIVAENEQPELIILGKRSIDGDNNQTGQMLAAMLNLPQGTSASGLKVNGGCIRVTRRVNRRLQTIELPLPAVITADLQLNEPRFALVKDHIKVRKEVLDSIAVEALDVDITPRTQLLFVDERPEKQAGVRVSNVEELISKLRNEVKVIA